MEERPVPVPGPGEVLVKVEAVGICAGDSKCFAGAARFWGKNMWDMERCPDSAACCPKCINMRYYAKKNLD